MSAISTDPQPISDGLGATILGPRNVDIEQQNPDGLIAPTTDAGTVPNLKFSYAAVHNRVLSGGWAREITTRELPIATELAGVNMRLTPGGIRELHWHKEAEWAYMIAWRMPGQRPRRRRPTVHRRRWRRRPVVFPRGAAAFDPGARERG